MNNTLKHLFVAALVILGLSSCEDFLNPMPDNALPSDSAINNMDDVAAALNGAYMALLDEGYYGADFISRAEVGGEDVQTSSASKRTESFYRFEYRVNNSPAGFWFYPYQAINRINTLLDAISSGKIADSEALNNAKGEALALRALCHFNLTLTYGYPYQKDDGASWGVPIVETVLPATAQPKRNTVAECYTFIEQDLTEALSLIGDAVNKGHFNKWAVLGLQARVALHKGDYETALSKAEEVITTGPYDLIPRADYVSAWGLEFTPESVLDLHVSDLMSGNRELFGYLVDPNGYGSVALTQDFITLLNEYPDDVRLNLLFNDGNGVKCLFNKYPGRNGASTVNNIRVIRLSDLYLIAAESALRQENPDQSKADTYLNAIRKRAIPSASDIIATIDLIDNERRKELVLEGHRLYDILRDGKSVTRDGGRHFLNAIDLKTVSWNDYRCVLAIPQAEIDANPNLKEQQNPEYK